ncbi:MAG TPA: hypothetical protein VN784_07210 [Candidatus Limnocylindrales bacterium]|nr:hypothetical protein [Candidatus Limnocylindrales bacterium]
MPAIAQVSLGATSHHRHDDAARTERRRPRRQVKAASRRAVFDELRAQSFKLQAIQPDGGVKVIYRFEELGGNLNPSGYVNLLCSR